MRERTWIILGLIAGALWLLTRGRSTATAAGSGGAAGGPVQVNATGPTFVEHLEVDAILDKLTGPYGQPYRVSVITPEYILRYQHLMPFDPYDSPVLNPANVQRP